MITRYCFGLIFLLATPKTVRAQDTCSTVRLDQVSPLKEMPIHDQGDTGTCTAQTAAQLLEAMIRNEGQTEAEVAPIALAIQRAALVVVGRKFGDRTKVTALGTREFAYDTGDRGSVCDAVRAANARGACRDSMFDALEDDAREALMRELWEIYARAAAADIADAPNPEVDVVGEVTECVKHLRIGNARRIQALADGLAESVKRLDFDMFLESVSRSYCRASDSLQAACADRTVRNKRQARDTLRHYFDNNPDLPLGIAYCADLMFDRGFEGPRGARCSGHVSIVVGRRRNPDTGVCEYLIRNSWGTACHSEYDWECDRGQMWVDERALGRNLVEVTRVKPKTEQGAQGGHSRKIQIRASR